MLIFEWIKLIILLLPILIFGILSIRKYTNIRSVGLFLSVGIIFGLSTFIFLLNLTSYLIKPPVSIFVSYFFIFGLMIYLFRKSIFRIEFNQNVLLFLGSSLFWCILIFWKASHPQLGGDTNLYWSIASSFANGNFPMLTPWQPDLNLSYHYGAFLLIGAFNYLTSLSFEFLHLFFVSIILVCITQQIVWLFFKKNNLLYFLLVNLTVGVVLIGSGFLKISDPEFLSKLNNIANINQIVVWLRTLPQGGVEGYGVPVSLDGLIYVIFYSFGLAVSLAVVSCLLYFKREQSLSGSVTLSLLFCSLALINESFFVVIIPAVFIYAFLNIRSKILFMILFFALGVSIFQGGIITESLFPKQSLESSVVFFPGKNDIKDDFFGYHLGQQLTKVREGWVYIGVELLIIFSLIAILISGEKNKLFVILFVMAISAVTAYNFIVPKYIVANGNRFIVIAFQLLSLLICLWISKLLAFDLKNKIVRIFALLLFIWISCLTVIPSFMSFSQTRFGENKMVPISSDQSSINLWLNENLTYQDRVLVFDRNSPHPSGIASFLRETGLLSPLFIGSYRAYTIEASPEYIDSFFTLNPSVLKKMKVNILVIDEEYYLKLPEARKKELEIDKLFSKIHEIKGINWTRVYRIKNEYLNSSKDLNGTLQEFSIFAPIEGDFYIDSEKNFIFDYLRRAIIFSLKDRNLFYIPESGVYLNVEANINHTDVSPGQKYDYLVLADQTNPKNVCNCEAIVVWQSELMKIKLWKNTSSLD